MTYHPSCFFHSTAKTSGGSQRPAVFMNPSVLSMSNGGSIYFMTSPSERTLYKSCASSRDILRSIHLFVTIICIHHFTAFGLFCIHHQDDSKGRRRHQLCNLSHLCLPSRIAFPPSLFFLRFVERFFRLFHLLLAIDGRKRPTFVSGYHSLLLFPGNLVLVIQTIIWA